MLGEQKRQKERPTPINTEGLSHSTMNAKDARAVRRKSITEIGKEEQSTIKLLSVLDGGSGQHYSPCEEKIGLSFHAVGSCGMEEKKLLRGFENQNCRRDVAEIERSQSTPPILHTRLIKT